MVAEPNTAEHQTSRPGKSFARLIPRIASRYWVALALMFSLTSIVLLSSQLHDRFRSLDNSNSGSVAWTWSQMDTELAQFNIELLNAKLKPDAPLSTLRNRYDIFFSRVETVLGVDAYRNMFSDPGMGANIARLQSFFEETLPIIDGPDEELRASLPYLETQVAVARTVVRALTIRGIANAAKAADQVRTEVSDLLLELAAFALALIVALSGLTMLLDYLYNTSKSRALAIRQTRDRLETIGRISLDAIFVLDLDGKVIDINRAGQEAFDTRRSAAIGRDFSDLSGVPDRICAGSNRRIRTTAQRPNGEMYPVELSISDAAGEKNPVVAVFLRDISDRVEAERALLRARDDALVGERSKAQFLAVMSHEMRTPLNGILGTIELMRDEPLSDQQQGYMKAMETSGKLLLHHVNDVLEISHHESGQARLNPTIFNLEALLKELVDSQQALVRPKGVNIRIVHIPGVLESAPVELVETDQMKLRQVLLNLLSNAVKYTDKGTITIEVEPISLDGDNLMVEIRVIDTGKGIEDDDLDRVFDDFVTLDVSYGRANGGTGLGLGIARRLAESLGGEIGAESVPGEGSLFWLHVPLVRILAPEGQGSGMPARDAKGEAPPNTPQSIRILIIEDNDINRFVLREMLNQYGHHIDEAIDGAKGLSLASEERYDLIFMDISMPQLDGVHATRKIREAGASSGAHIVALTAHAMPDELISFRKAGADGCLIKPITRADLAGVLTRVAAKLRQERQSAKPAPLANSRLLSELVSELGNEQSAALIRRFIGEADAAVGQIKSLAKDDPAGLRDLFHKIGGSAATFGAQRWLEKLRKCETLFEAQITDSANPCFKEVFALWVETRRTYEIVLHSIETAEQRPDPAI